MWSAGTVLFEMIAGKPPFHGENHIDLLRNIQQKAVRLPPNVKISAEGVKLLRVLLHRNPISRAGFSVFSDASDAFVALGCNGVAATIVDETTTTSSTTASTLGVDDIASNYQQHNSMAVNNNLGPISEVEESHNLGQQQGSVGTLSTHHPIDVQQREQEVENQNGQYSFLCILKICVFKICYCVKAQFKLMLLFYQI
jgi:serine/threonine protein kinase